MAGTPHTKRTTVPALQRMKSEGKRIVMLTAYDYPTARLLDEAGVDIILVGDSLGMVVLGFPDTLAVTLEQMLHHAAAVCRGVRRALVVGDMPFLSTGISAEKTVENAGRFIKEAGVHAVKLEGGMRAVAEVEALVRAQIPVMGHIGLTPQSLNMMGGYRIQGRTQEAVETLVQDAQALEAAGCFSLVLEGALPEATARVTQAVRIPTIGIGAGNQCDGQVLVIHDLLGWSADESPTFVKRYANLWGVTSEAVQQFCREVRAGEFPTEEYSYSGSPILKKASKDHRTGG